MTGILTTAVTAVTVLLMLPGAKSVVIGVVDAAVRGLW